MIRWKKLKKRAGGSFDRNNGGAACGGVCRRFYF